MTAGIVEVRPE